MTKALQRRVPVPPLAAEPDPVPVLLYGAGAIGAGVARAIRRSRGLRLVAAVDADPAKIGLDLGSLLGEEPWGVVVRADLGDVAGARVAVHTTGSFLPDIKAQVEALVGAGLHVVSSTEELAWPWLRHPELSAELDAVCRQAACTVVGTGVNPGFVMDVLPLVATHAVRDVRRVVIRRRVDTALRRRNLQVKTGAGMTVSAFGSEMAAGRMGHIGLAESLAMVAAGLGWPVGDIHEELAPIVSEAGTRSTEIEVPAGHVAGLRQTMEARTGDGRTVVLELVMELAGGGDADEVELESDPPVRLRVEGGVSGDKATVATLVNTVGRVLEAPRGLRSALDLPLPRVTG